jgi:CheY-like chemotaxis protein
LNSNCFISSNFFIGYLVTTAHNGSAGLDRLIEGYEMFEFDMALIDLQMPVMDGIESVSRYREFERKNREIVALATPEVTLRKRLPIIGMSANSDNATKQLALNAGMDLFIPKPFILSELEPLIYQLLQRKLPSFEDHDGEYISGKGTPATDGNITGRGTPVTDGYNSPETFPVRVHR